MLLLLLLFILYVICNTLQVYNSYDTAVKDAVLMNKSAEESSLLGSDGSNANYGTHN